MTPFRDPVGQVVKNTRKIDVTLRKRMKTMNFETTLARVERQVARRGGGGPYARLRWGGGGGP